MGNVKGKRKRHKKKCHKNKKEKNYKINIKNNVRQKKYLENKWNNASKLPLIYFFLSFPVQHLQSLSSQF